MGGGGDVSDSEESDEISMTFGLELMIVDCDGELGIWIVIVVIWGFSTSYL